MTDFFFFSSFQQNKRKSNSPVTAVVEKEPPIKKTKTVSYLNKLCCFCTISYRKSHLSSVPLVTGVLL